MCVEFYHLYLNLLERKYGVFRLLQKLACTLGPLCLLSVMCLSVGRYSADLNFHPSTGNLIRNCTHFHDSYG